MTFRRRTVPPRQEELIPAQPLLAFATEAAEEPHGPRWAPAAAVGPDK